MPNSPHHVPAWPLYRLQADASGAVTVTGPAAPHGPYDSRTGAVAAVAAAIPRTVRAEAVEADGATVPLVIHPDGTAETTGPTRRPPKRRQRERPGETAREPETRQVPTPAEPEPTAQAPAPVAEPLPAPRGPDDNPPATPLRIHEPQPPEATAGPAVSAAVGAIQRAVHAGHLDEALRLAAQADDALARTHGPSHTEALKAREVRAHIASLRGEFSAAALLYRDSAERWQIQGEA